MKEINPKITMTIFSKIVSLLAPLKRYIKMSKIPNILSQLLWYILPKFSTVIRHLRRNLKSKGYLLINQAFYKPGKQKYGNKIISSIEDMLRLLRNYKIVELIEIDSRLEDHNVVTLLKPKVYL